MNEVARFSWVLLLSALSGSSAGCEASEPVEAAVPRTERSFAVLAGPDEPGEPLEVSGVVFEPDGTTPAMGVVLYVYHTDNAGHYQRERDAPPRLRAWLVTDEQGRYRYRTIRPAAYPGRTTPAHIHTQLWNERFPPQYGTDLEFADDPLLPPEELERSKRLGRFGFVVEPLRDENGVWRATHDLRLAETGDEFEDNTMHGLSDCPEELAPPRR